MTGDRRNLGRRVVRTVADRAFLPAKGMLEEVGDMMILTGKTIMSALRPPYPYGGEFVNQFLFALKLCWFPLVVSTVAFGYGAPGLQAGNFLVLFGAIDRLGVFFVLASIREFAPFVTAIVLAGVAGTAITADLGARKIREELDALQVLGVDPVKNLVVPRFLALMIVTGLFNIYALLFGIFGGVLATLTFDAPLGPFFATLLTNASTTDLWGSVVKTTLFGAIIAIVSCYKGMTASGGAEGVGRAVNQGVVIECQRVLTPTGCSPDGDRLAERPARLDRLVRRHREVLRPRRRLSVQRQGLPLLRRGAAAGRHPDPRLRARDLGPRVHPRAPVRHRGRVLQPLGGRSRVRGRLQRLVRPARDHALRLRLHDVGEGRYRARGGDRRHADLRRDRRARGDGHQLARVPVRHPPARGLDGAPLHVHRGGRRGFLRELSGGGRADRGGLVRRVLPDLLDVPEPARPVLQPDQGHDDGHRDRARWLLLRVQRERGAGGSRHRDGEVDGAEHGDGPSRGNGGDADLLGLESTSTDRRVREK